MRWTWDPVKNRANRRVHDVSFEAAILAFEDPLATTLEDPYPHERRWRTVGMAGPALLIVVHTWPEPDCGVGESVGRIISARKVTRHERKAYEEGIF